MNGATLTFHDLFKQEKHGLVQIPIIQRDFAQGRPSEWELRNAFLDSIFNALSKKQDDPTLPLDLDFIYGSVEIDGLETFYPLDGQQRLTTLFLLHWYLSWVDNKFDKFKEFITLDGKSRFSYSIRPSSREFFDELVNWSPERDWTLKYDSIRNVIEDQPWFFQWWIRDPTINSALNMLVTIHEKFSEATGFYSRLVNIDQPYVTFQLLDLDNFGLSDDLYIKMNARGKALTSFEVFKARLESHIQTTFPAETKKLNGENVRVKDYFSHKIDTTWADLFWDYRDVFSLYDNKIMNLVRTLGVLSRIPDSIDFEVVVNELRNSRTLTYQKYIDINCLDRTHLDLLMVVLDHFSQKDDVPSLIAFDQWAALKRILNEGAAAPYWALLQFYAYVGYVRLHQSALNANECEDWMRVVVNLTTNSNLERPEEFRTGLQSINALLSHSSDILKFFASSATKIYGFSVQQIQEERVKASLILRNNGWRAAISLAEAHGYLKGQVEFLLDFCGVLNAWRSATEDSWASLLNTQYLESFEEYFKKTELFFSNYGLRSYGNFRTERALLALGDYLLPQGPNYSFVENAQSSSASWKLLLRGTLNEPSKGRGILKNLMDRIDLQANVTETLDNVIETNVPSDDWRQLFVSNPLLIAYCSKRQIRYNDDHNIFLLKGQRRNGEHVELYTYHLYTAFLMKESSAGKLKPFTQLTYNAVNTDEYVPSISLEGKIDSQSVRVTIWNYGISKFRFRLWSSDAELLEMLRQKLRGNYEGATLLVDAELDIVKVRKIMEKILKTLRKTLTQENL